MLKAHNPNTIAAPLVPTYVNAMEAPAGSRWLYVSGQVGVDPAGKTVPDYEGQCRQIWTNIIELLKSADMTVNDIVKMTAFVVSGQSMPSYGKIRGEYLKGHKPASTMIAVPALLKPEFLIEVEVIAAAK
jgi:enamine deaminase RidA (YjgF/YER057c/UK114 family)